jgi:hypothetical protein
MERNTYEVLLRGPEEMDDFQPRKKVYIVAQDMTHASRRASTYAAQENLIPENLRLVGRCIAVEEVE